MKAQTEKADSNKSNAVARAATGEQKKEESGDQFDDKRVEVVAQRKLAGLADASPQAGRVAQMQAIADGSAVGTVQRVGLDEEEPLQGKFKTIQRQGAEEEEELLQGKFETIQKQEEEEEELQMKSETIQKKGSEQEEIQTRTALVQKKDGKPANNTGLPDALKSGMESLSGMSLDDVKVHRNSDKPAQLQAHAYAQGTDIHLGPGQEKHLPHEAWHVVQQKQGRVKPTMQMKDGVPVNDDDGLEREADVMGGKATRMKGGMHDLRLDHVFYVDKQPTSDTRNQDTPLQLEAQPTMKKVVQRLDPLSVGLMVGGTVLGGLIVRAIWRRYKRKPQNTEVELIQDQLVDNIGGKSKEEQTIEIDNFLDANKLEPVAAPEPAAEAEFKAIEQSDEELAPEAAGESDSVVAPKSIVEDLVEAAVRCRAGVRKLQVDNKLDKENLDQPKKWRKFGFGAIVDEDSQNAAWLYTTLHRLNMNLAKSRDTLTKKFKTSLDVEPPGITSKSGTFTEWAAFVANGSCAEMGSGDCVQWAKQISERNGINWGQYEGLVAAAQEKGRKEQVAYDEAKAAYGRAGGDLKMPPEELKGSDATAYLHQLIVLNRKTATIAQIKIVYLRERKKLYELMVLDEEDDNTTKWSKVGPDLYRGK